jgi:hypothetical protein
MLQNLEQIIMATDVGIEERVSQLETRLNLLERRVASEPASDWLQQFVGAFQKYPSFSDVIKYGREFRDSQPYADDEHPA